MESTSPVEPGLTLTDNLYPVVLHAYTHPFKVKGDFARENAWYVAMAASMGLITTQHIDGEFGQSWYVTVMGLDWLHMEVQG